MRKKRSVSTITKYLPVLIILIAITIMVGSTLAYFTDEEQSESTLRFNKVELSSDTQVGYDGTLNDVIPGDSLIKEPLMVSKAIDSEAVYIRAKLSFTYAQDATEAEKTLLKPYLKALRESNDFNILSEVQGSGASAAKWSAKDGNYIYLMENTSEGEPVALKRVEDNTIYTLSNNITLPRDLEQLEDENGNHAQYGKKIVFNIAFQAIQADNVTTNVAGVKELFDITFPELDAESSGIKVNLMVKDNGSFKAMPLTLKDDNTVEIPELTVELIGNDVIFTGNFYKSYIDGVYTQQIDLSQPITDDTTIYPELIPTTSGLVFTLKEDGTYMVGDGTTTNTNGLTSDVRSSTTSVTIPMFHDNKLVTSIGTYAFSASKLVTVTMLDSITEIGVSAFENSDSLEVFDISKGVTHIGNRAFYGCDNFTEVVIPNHIESIGDSAYNNCANLVSVTVPEGVTSIGASAFYYCKKLANISLPDSLTYLGDSALYYCDALQTVTNGACKYVGNTENPYLVLFKCSSQFTSSCTIPAGCKFIASYAFYACGQLKSIALPDGMLGILDSAFDDCIRLAQITGTDTLNHIGSRAFYDCNALKSIELPEGLKEIGGQAFYYNYALTEITIPSTVEEISRYAFFNCYNIRSVNISEGVKTIATNAFGQCYRLNTVNIPSTVDSVASDAFDKCGAIVHVRNLSSVDSASLGIASCVRQEILTDNSNFAYALQPTSDEKYLTYYVSANEIYLMGFNGSATTANDIPANITHIYDYAFYVDKSLTSIVIPEGVTTTGNYTFVGCTALSSVTLPSTLVEIGAHAFQTCDKLKTLNIPSSVRTIGDSAFNYGAYTSISLPEGVQTIGSGAFSTCSGLGDFVIPSTVTSIGSGAFRESSSLTSITIPEGITVLESSTFYRCTGMRSITLPSTLVTIGDYALRDCKALTSIDIPSGVTSIGEQAFDTCTGLTSIELPAGVTSIGRSAFSSCSGLQTINIPESVTKIGNNAFYGCTKVATVYYDAIAINGFNSRNNIFGNVGQSVGGATIIIGNKVTVIPQRMFSPYPSASNYNMIVKEVRFEENSVCTKIGYGAFEYCDDLLTITLPSSITTIDNNAFSNTGSAQIICPNDTVAALANGKGNTNIVVAN